MSASHPVGLPPHYPEDKLPPAPAEFEIEPRPEMLCFRGQTMAILRHFFETSRQMGRLPSILAREFFRARISHHAIPSFEDQAVFVRDVEICLSRLRPEDYTLVTLIGLYDFSRDEVAAGMNRSRSWVSECLARALDTLAEQFLRAGLLRESRPDRRQVQLSAHAGRTRLGARLRWKRKHRPPQPATIEYEEAQPSSA